MKIKIYTDGASRGNPGPASYAFIITDGKGKEVARDSGRLGTSTNNRAEYTAVIKALQRASDLTEGEVEVFSDSRLVVNQAQGNWKIKSKGIKPLVGEIRELKNKFDGVGFTHVSRENEMTKKVDKMCNERLDRGR